MYIPKPFHPLQYTSDGVQHTVKVTGREIIYGQNALPVSIKSLGQELLAGPVRLVGSEAGEPIVWDTAYPDNESECYLQSHSDEEVTLCGAMQSQRFIIDVAMKTEFDGCMSMDLKLMTRGRTVQQIYGLDSVRPLEYKLDHLWLEIPVKKKLAKFFNVYPNGAMYLSDGSVLPETTITCSGRIPELDASLPFKALCWVGNDDLGVGFFAEKAENWQAADENRVVEWVNTADALVIRIHLLDSHPVTWTANPCNGSGEYYPISFRLGMMATPVKPFPKKPYLHNGLHIDCFVKIKGNYRDFLDSNNYFDRLVEKDVTTLVLHEKWNKSQNQFHPSEATLEQLRYIVDQCHSRGIKVLPYFGYEMSTMNPQWMDQAEVSIAKHENSTPCGRWYRVPYQRAYVLCQNSTYARSFADAVAWLMDEYHIDGVYLDGTAIPFPCANTAHGCGWVDQNGKLRASYPLSGIRRVMRELYRVVERRGGMVNVHFGCPNFLALPYVDLCWYGEAMQMDYIKGGVADMPLDHFRAAYAGRNMGVPSEFIAYQNRPVWNFENAIAMSCIHGILPRPNDIEQPLDLMAEVWKIMNRFPIDKAAWMPYWKNDAVVSAPSVKVSYYRYTTLDGSNQSLIFCANTSAEEVRTRIVLPEDYLRQYDLTDSRKSCSSELYFEPYGYRILYYC